MIKCWFCGSITSEFMVRPDAGMAGLTDECVCVGCGATQPDDVLTEVLFQQGALR